jgi:Pro-kumamolisin, activation domain/Bacterial Ig-like domain (group 3)/Subtilase family
MKLSVLFCLCVLPSLTGVSGHVLAQTAAAPQHVSRITAPIDESQLVTLKGNVHPLAVHGVDQGPAPASNPTGRVLLVLRRSAAQQEALAQYLSDLQNPAAPNYHKWLTPVEYGAQFGVAASDLQTVESWLQSHGFRIEKAPASNNVIAFSGTIGQVQTAFHTSIHAFAVRGETRFANVTDAQIPSALAPVIAGVGPLNNFPLQPNVEVSATGTWDATTHSIEPNLTLFGANHTPYLFVDPADAATIYDTPNGALNANYKSGTSYTGNGATIGIIGVSDLYLPDIQNYRTGFLGESSTSINLPTVIVDGNDPGVVPGGAGIEALIDNEIAGGLAPGAKINFYISAGSDLTDGVLDALARAVDDNAVDILSMSFGACETGLGTSGNQLVLELTEQAAAQGISVTVSSGDGGSAGCDNFDTQTTAQQGLAVSGLASSPYVIAVGGTDFDVLPTSFSTYASTTTSGTAPYYLTALGYIPEKPWNDSTTSNTSLSQNVAYKNGSGQTNIIAGSGGVSAIYAKPAFQASLTPADSHRDLPDVSLLAGNGFYSAVWAACSDTAINGNGSFPTSDCANSSGQFANGTTFTGVGGTSASAPAFAGMLALAVQATGGRLGQADMVLYQLAQAHPSYFHDITSGDNSVPCATGSPNCGSNGFLTGYNATSGYDLASGLGSVDAAAIVNNWKSVSLGSSSTTLQINGSTSAYTGVHGANLTFNVGVTGPGGTPTGVAAITDSANMTAGGTSAGPQNNGQFAIPLTSGSGSATYNGLPGGTYTVTARYGGDTSFASSTSTPINVSISAEPSTTTLTVNAYDPSTGKQIPNSTIPYGNDVFADANITGTADGASTQGVATGTVQFLNGSAILGTSAVNSGNQASWPPLNSTFQALPAGSYSLTAKYSGDASYSASTGAASFIITKAPTTISAGYSGTPVQYGTLEQINTDVLTNSYGIAPTGTFQFYVDGQPVLAPQPIYESSGYQPNNKTSPWAWADSSANYAFVPIGQHTLSATYSGDNNYSAGTSPNTAVVVTQAYANISGFGFANPQGDPVVVGQTRTGIATVFGSQYGLAPTGTITFYDNNVALTNPVTYTSSYNPPALSVLNATTQHVFTTPGTDQITVSYSGDANYRSATSSGAQSLNVLGPVSVTPAGIMTIPVPGQSGSVSLTVTPNGGFTGTVTLSCAAPSSAAETTCGFGTGSNITPTLQITITGPSATANFNVTTTAQHQVAALSEGRSSGLLLAVLILVIAPIKRWRRTLRLMALAIVLVLSQASCGGGGGGSGGGGGTTDPGTPVGTYSFTVTAATGSGSSAFSTPSQVTVWVQ